MYRDQGSDVKGKFDFGSVVQVEWGGDRRTEDASKLAKVMSTSKAIGMRL